MTYKCEKCLDTGSIKGELYLDCASCDVAKERADLHAYLAKNQFMHPYELAWLVHQRALSLAAAPQVVADERKVSPCPEYDRGFLNGWDACQARAALAAAPVQVQEPVAWRRMAKHAWEYRANAPTDAMKSQGWLPLHDRAPVQAQEPRPELTVWYGAMPESNGKSNFTATLKRKDARPFDTNSYTFQRSEYPERVRYEADCMRYLIGEIGTKPDILAYDADKHSGYVAPVQPVAVPDGDAPGYKPQVEETVFYSRLGLSDDGLPFMTDSSVNGTWDIAMVFEKGGKRPSKFFSMHDYLAAPAAQGDAKDADRLEFIESGTFDLRCYNDHDNDVYWNVIEHHMAAPIEREIGWGNTARQAIDAAIAAKAAS